MRFIEIILTIVNVFTFFTCVLPRISAVRWVSYMPLATLLVAGVQIIVEGPRWQMVPEYIVPSVFFLIWLLGALTPGGIHVKRVISFLGIGLGIIVLIISIALPALLPVFRFPAPTGPYAIGTVTYHWTDTNRPELFTADPNDHRELTVQVWYPAKNEPTAPHAPYIQDADTITPQIGRLLHLPQFIFSHLKYVTTNAVASAPIADEEANYPVLIYLTGVDGFRSVNTFQVEELVSHGYIVADIDQPGIAPLVHLSDGRNVVGLTRDQIQPMINQSVELQPTIPELNGKLLPDGIIPYFAQDASFTLDQLAVINMNDPNHILTGRLDLGHVGTFGVSLGGYVDIPKMFHVNFTDIPYWSPAFSLIDMTGPINGRRGFDIVNAYSVAFFNKELKGQASSLLNGPSKQYPEADLEMLRE